MKIGELNMHCGLCDIIDFCGNPYGYCICNQERFKHIDEQDYNKNAKMATTIPYAGCLDCIEDDCTGCYIEDEARDWQCKQIAEHVAAMIL